MKIFKNICDWFVYNKLTIHFNNYKTKSILFASKFKLKKVRKLNIKYGDIQIKQHSKVKYSESMVDKTMSGEAMTLSVFKINNELKFLHHKNKFLTLALRQLLCNPLFNLILTCFVSYLNLTNKLKNKIYKTQNKCEHFFLQLNKMVHISCKELQTLNCLPMTENFKQCINSMFFKYLNDQCHFNNYKTKSILFASKFKLKKVKKLNIKYGDIQIKQHSKVKYSESMVDKTMSGEAMTLSVFKINNELKFLHQKNRFLTLALRQFENSYSLYHYLSLGQLFILQAKVCNIFSL